MVLALLFLQIINLIYAQFVPISHWNTKEPTLLFTSNAQTTYNKLCSSPVTLKTTFGGAAANPVSSPLTVNLSVTAGLIYYSDKNCLIPVTDITIASSTSESTFYFKYANSGVITMTATSAGWKSASQNATLTSNPFIWTGGGGPSTTWSTGLNWSGGVPPAAGNTAIFDDVCVSNCSPTILSNITVGGIRIEASYSGIITQGAFNLIITQGGYVQSGGTFSGSLDPTKFISVENGNFAINGGTYTSPIFKTRVSNSWQIISSPTVTFPSNSTLETFCDLASWECFSNSINFAPSTVSYENVTLSGYGTSYSVNGATMTILKNLTTGDPYTSPMFRNGNIHLYGNLNHPSGNLRSDNSKIILKGNASGQTISGVSGTGMDIEIDAGANNVTLTGSYSTTGWTVTSVGTFTSTGSTLTFNCTSSSLLCFSNPFPIRPNSSSYNNIVIDGYRNDIDLGGDTWNVDGNFSFTSRGGQRKIDNGTILLKGNLTHTSSSGYYGTATVKLIGNPSGQTITGIGDFFPRIEIDAGTNNVTLAGQISIEDTFNITSIGTLNTSGSTLTFDCSNSTRPCFASNVNFNHGNFTYNHIKFKLYQGTLNLGGSTLKIAGDLTFSTQTISNGTYNNGLIEVGGNFLQTNGNSLGTAGLTFNGTGAQSITANSTNILDGNIIINKTSGTLSLATNIDFNGVSQDFTITNGQVNMAGFNLTVTDTLTIALGTTLTRGGGTLAYGSLVNNGTLNP